jgi:hypothetical protein
MRFPQTFERLGALFYAAEASVEAAAVRRRDGIPATRQLTSTGPGSS